MNVDTTTRRFHLAALLIYLAAFAVVQAMDLMPRNPVLHLGLLLSMALMLLLVVDSRIRRMLQLETTLQFRFDDLGKQGWLWMLVLVFVGAFLEPRVRSNNWFQPWLYALVTFFWMEAFVTILKYFRRTK
jgi:hypothetical protein